MVAVRTYTLDAGALGNRDCDAGIEESGCESGFAEAGTACYADFFGVDFGDLEREAVEDAVEAPGPGEEGACFG